MKKLIAEQDLKKDRLSKAFIALLIVLAFALSVVRVVIANRLVEASGNLRSLDTQITDIQEQNQLLSEKLRTPQAIESVEARAKEQGFVKTTAYVFLETSPSTAMQSDVESTLR